MADANVKLKVNTEELDRLKGKLVELQKGLSVQLDIDGKPMDIVLDKTMNLTKQARLLRNEMSKTTDKAMFQAMASKLGDIEDKIQKTKASSTDLFASLSLLPGPIGQFFGRLTGVVGLMKTFSSFNLKDLRFQLKETINDFKDIFDNLGRLLERKKGLDKTTETGGAGAKSTATNADTAATVAETTAERENTNATQQNAAAQVESAAAKRIDTQATNDDKNAILQLTQAKKIEADTTYDQLKAAIEHQGAINSNVNATKEQKKAAADAVEELLRKQEALDEEIDVLLKNSSAQEINNDKVDEGKKKIKEQGEEVKKAESFWTRFGTTLKGALVAGAIGVAIYVISDLLTRLYEWITGTKKAEEAARNFSDALKEQNYWLSYNANEIKRRGAEKIADMRAEGKSAKEIRTEELNQATLLNQQLFKDQEDAYNKRAQLLKENRIKETDEAAEDYRKKREAYLQSVSDLRILESRNREEDRKETEANNQEKLRKNKEYLDKLIQDTETARKKLRDLEEENFLSLIEDEREREGVRLSYEKKKEEEEIKALDLKDTIINKKKVTKEELLRRLLEQVKQKYAIITINNQKKYNEEDLKRSEEFNDKLRDLLISTYEDEVERDIANREEKYQRDLREFERDKEFIKKSETEKNEIRKNLRKAADIDIEKIKFDAMVKGFNDELDILEAQQKTLTEGTQAYLDNAIAIENQAYAIKIANAKGNAKQIEAINIEHEQNLKNIKLSAFEAQKQIDIQRAQSVMTIGTTLQQLAGKNKALATYGVVLEKAGAISQIVSNTQIANAKARSASTITGGQPWVTINNVSAALGIAATIAAAAKSISEIQGVGASANNPQASAGSVRGMARGGYIDGPRHAQGGTIIEAEGGEAIMTRGAVSMFRPILSMMNEAGGGTSFNKNLMVTANDAPLTTKPAEQMAPTIVKTYVVSNELTSEQEKLARLKNLSTL